MMEPDPQATLSSDYIVSDAPVKSIDNFILAILLKQGTGKAAKDGSEI
jgi:hypothetical protein